MKRFIFLILPIFLALSACSPEDMQEINKVKYQGIIGQEFKSYQIRSLDPGPMNDTIVFVDGDFGGVPIKAGRTDLYDIVFVVPVIPPGTYQLKLLIGDEFLIWDVKVVDQAIDVEDSGDFWQDYFAGSDIIFDSLKNYARFDSYAEDAKKWSNYFETQYSGLSQKEKNELIYLIHRNGFEKIVPFSFEVPGEFENCLEENFAVYAMNSFEEGWYQKEVKSRMYFLPSSRINDAFLAFMGDLIWRDRAVEGILAPKVFACPILREVLLQTKFGPVTAEPIVFNSGDSLGIKLTGVYSKLSSVDKSSQVEGLADKVNYFDIAKYQRLYDTGIISALKQIKNLDLPFFNRSPFLFLPIQGEEEKRPLNGFTAEIGSISNPDVTLSQISQNEGLLILTFEKKKAERQGFQFTTHLSQSGFSIAKIVTGTMPDISELILDLSFDKGTAYLQIISGQEPFDISWSNGMKNETDVKFNSGSYSVKVQDGNGNEKVIEFKIPEFGTVKDREGNEYQTVKIGERWWMAENLRNTIREDGRPIEESPNWIPYHPGIAPDYDFAKYSYYQNAPENDKRYGKLYNIHAFEVCICPDGWGMPTVEEFTKMSEVLGGSSVAGQKLKIRSNWKESIVNATNESGFNAKPGGLKYDLKYYQDEEVFVGWWAKPQELPNLIAYLEAGTSQLKTMSRTSFYFEGHYIRCIKKE